MLVGDYVNQVLAPVKPTIIYPLFRQTNFYLRLNVINLFQYHQDVKFFGKATESLHEHVQTFMKLCGVISHEGILADAF